MNYYPLFLDLKDQPCLVVGGGEVAQRKVDLLRRSGARIKLIAPEVTPMLAQWAQQRMIDWQAESADPQALGDFRLVIAATDDEALNQRIAAACKRRGMLVNVVDAPELSNCISPAIVDRSPLLIAISSGGVAPVLARMWRARLEAMIPAAYGQLAALAAEFREQVKQRIPRDQRLRFWEQVFDGPVAEQGLSGQTTRARELLTRMLEQPGQPLQGEVYLVGAGPGDPDLLTFRALRLMQKADVVLYDRLVSAPVLELVRRDAERIYVGKARSQHALPQEEINLKLVELAQAGKRVLRLKGGDPFIFGRGGEEIALLAEHRIPFQIVPGITAASGCAAYAGIPLTHRDYAQACQFVTGHPREDGSLGLNWASLAQPNQTVVIYMGLTGLEQLCRQLIKHGLAPTHPAAIIQQGTTPAQRVLVSDLQNLPVQAQTARLKAPTLVIVGEVVRLHESLAWYQGDPQVHSAFGGGNG